jgi:hypothetical protein
MDWTRAGLDQEHRSSTGRLPASENLMRIARLVEQDPAHTYALLQHAVVGGAIKLHDKEKAGQGTPGLPANIPHRIMQYWHAERPPDEVRQAILNVQTCNPEAACSVLHEETARDFIAAHFGAGMRSLFDFCFHHTMKSDLVRLCYLYVHGGIYVDVDIRCHAPLANILANSNFRCFLFHAVGQPWCIENGFIAAEPENPLIAAMIRRLAHNLLLYRDRKRFRGIWADTGPGVATETIIGMFARYLLTGEGADMIDGFLTARNDLCAVSYCHDELQYKRTAEGNWRLAIPPETALKPP